jgi:hypothetical protein
MRKSMVFAAGVLALVVVAAAPAMSERAAVTGPQLRNYLIKVQPLHARYVAIRRAEVADLSRALSGDVSGLLADRSAMSALATRIAGVHRSAVLREPHASLVRSLRMHAALIAFSADAIGSRNLSALFSETDEVLPEVKDLQLHWSAEVNATLRRAGTTVPYWVKNVGAW